MLLSFYNTNNSMTITKCALLDMIRGHMSVYNDISCFILLLLGKDNKITCP